MTHAAHDPRRGRLIVLAGPSGVGKSSVVAGLRQRSLNQIRADHAVTKQASEKQLAEWLEQQHKVDPIHK